MPALEPILPSIAIGLLLIVMLWFTFGTQRNIRKGNDLVRWLQGGLPHIGSRSTLRWLGSSAVELQIANANAPFREATVMIVLEPRDVGLLWAFSRSRGRHDFLIIRGNLRRAPRFSLDVGDPRGWTGRIEQRDGAAVSRRASGQQAVDGERPIDWPRGCVAMAGPGADVAAAREAWDRLGRASAGVWRMTIQPVVPHMEIHLRPPADGGSAERIVVPIRELAIAIARE